MKTISAELQQLIEDASTDGVLGSLPPAAAEKDIHITDVLFALSTLNHSVEVLPLGPQKGKMPPTKVKSRLVFAGGTCLSKAHKLIERMSEDIDIKVVLEPEPEGYVKMAIRRRLRSLHTAVEERLTALGFEFVEVEEGDSNPHIKDERRYYCLAISYQANLGGAAGILRPQIKLEIIHRHPVLGSAEGPLSYILDYYAWNAKGLIAPQHFQMPLIDVAETLAEKVLSMLRRYAWNISGAQRGEFDTALIRHIYDVWRIVNVQPDALLRAKQIFHELVATDAREFARQNTEFNERPYEVLRHSLETIEQDAVLRENYAQRLMPLLFATQKPDFEICFTEFKRVALELLEHSEPQVEELAGPVIAS